MINTISFVTGIWDLNRDNAPEGWTRSFDHYIDYFIFYLVLLLLYSINYGVSPGDGVSHSVVLIHFKQPFSS